MTLLALILLSLSLAMDCFAVSVSCGAHSSMKRSVGLKMALSFGIFQGGMLLLGSFLGTSFRFLIENIDHWIAFGLLVIIGGKMIYEALKGEEDCSMNLGSWKVLVSLSVATSIDAFVVGISLGLQQVNLFESSAIVALGSFLLTVIGLRLGKNIKHIGPQIAECVGGIVLIGIGVKTLIEHQALPL